MVRIVIGVYLFGLAPTVFGQVEIQPFVFKIRSVLETLVLEDYLFENLFR